MNTPAHLVVNLALLGGGSRRDAAGAIALGALLPDLPMFAFFAWETLVRATPQRAIWDERYFDPGWQAAFDLFNSIPLFGVGLAAALWRRSRVLAALCASVLLHCLLDLPFHREDGHRHLFPLSDWRFMSPVSYWDPAHGGALGAGLEGVFVVAAACVLWRRHPRVGVRTALALLAAFTVSAWVLFYGLGRLPDV
ncbi:MAG: hypothetical protein ACQGVC_00305 [Myxococcota bacterium]